MKTCQYKLLVIAGLFSKSSINNMIVKVFQQFFGIDSGDTLSIDLAKCKNIDEAKSYIKMCLDRLGPNTIVIGHSAGGQLAMWLADDSNAVLIIPIDAPSHNPLDFPLSLWTRTARYLRETLTNQFFCLQEDIMLKVFGAVVSKEMTGGSWGQLVSQMNFGWVGGNPSPPKPLFGNKVLFVASTGDPLITQRVVKKNAKRAGGHLMILYCGDHFPQLGSGAQRRMKEVAERAQSIMQKNQNGMVNE